MDETSDGITYTELTKFETIYLSSWLEDP